MTRLKTGFFRLGALFLLALLTTITVSLALAKLKHMTPARLSPEIGAGAAPAKAPDKSQVSETLGRLPLGFEANRGQCDGSADFIARGPGYSLFLSATEAAMALRRNESGLLRMRLKGANRSARGDGVGELPGKSNYIITRDSRHWRAGIEQFRKVRYEGVYSAADPSIPASQSRSTRQARSM